MKQNKKDYKYILFDLDGTITDPAIGYYREYYAPKGIFECDLYAGIADMFAELKARGKEELEDAGADYIVDEPMEILEYTL